MKTLIVGAGALGGVIAARFLACGSSVALATRDSVSAQTIRQTGLHVTGVGGDASVSAVEVAPLSAYTPSDKFELVLLATKAKEAIELAPILMTLLADDGTLLPIQNGGVPQMLASRFGEDRVLGGLSNLGATMVEHGRYQQRNAGHILIGELRGATSERAERVQQWVSRSVSVKVTNNLRGAIWSKLLLNCSVTTIGAITGGTMRQYIHLPQGHALFEQTYEESLSVAIASGNQPERMLVEPVPPSSPGEPPYETWLESILQHYGDLKPSMLQDFERGRATEIAFINGYVADIGRELGLRVAVNDAIVDTVQAITDGTKRPTLSMLDDVLSMVSI